MHAMVLVLLGLLACAPFSQSINCPDAVYRVAESIPLGMSLPPTDISTFQAWKEIISNATKTIDLAAFYVTFTDGGYPPVDGGEYGQEIYDLLKQAKLERGVRIRLVELMPSADMPDTDSIVLAQEGIIELRNINWVELIGDGILHTKLLISDRENVYIGSANSDWRSLSQVKELGVVVSKCPLIAEDALKEFEMYWAAAEMTKLPAVWDPKYATNYDLQSPAVVSMNGTEELVFIAASPPEFVASNRTGDIDALLNAINTASANISIEVMDYCPCSMYNGRGKNTYWGLIDDALRNAAFHGRYVRFLAAKWNHTDPYTIQYLQSLDVLDNVEVKFFIVPPFGNDTVPYTRVNHAKFMVTDRQTYVGTSNWTEDYFTNTGGMSFTWYSEPMRAKVQGIFDRDWNSQYTSPLPKPKL